MNCHCVLQRPLFALLFGCWVWGAAAASLQAQPGFFGLLPQKDLQRFGLERDWQTQIALSPQAGGIVNVFQHASATQGVYAAEVTWEGGRELFRDSDLDTFGKMLGPERAKLAADELMAELTAKGYKPQLQEHNLPVLTLYVATETGNVQAIDAETGQTLWENRIGLSRHPTTEVAASEKYVAVVNGTTLYLLDRMDGNTIWARRTLGVPGAGPVVNDEFIFLPAVNGALELYKPLDPVARVQLYRSTGRALIQPTLTSRTVLWPTDAGFLYAASANRYALYYRLEANRAIVDQPAVSDGRVFVCSLDGYIYCIREVDGNMLWSYATGEPISRSPLAVGDVVYFSTEPGNLYCLNVETGEQLPGARGVKQVLAVSNKRIYASGMNAELIILDRNSRTLLGNMPDIRIGHAVVNRTTDRLLLVNHHGLIQCVRELGAEFPTLHVDVLEPPPPPVEDQPGAASPTATPDEVPPAPEDADPFGGGEMDDPFAAPGADADPFGAPPPATDDPFGAPAADTDDPFGSP